MDKLTDGATTAEERMVFEDATYCCEQCFADTGIKLINKHTALLKEAIPLLKASRIAADKQGMVALSKAIELLLLRIGAA